MKNKLVKIRKINFTGKWAEFWFEEEQKIIPANPNSEYEHLRVEQDMWIHSCKLLKIYALAKEAELEDEVINNGFIGLNTEWEYVFPNWNLIRVFKDDITYPKYETSKVNILKDGHIMSMEDIVTDLNRKSYLEKLITNMHTDEDVKMFAEFLICEGILIKEESKNHSMSYLFDIWSGKNPNGLL